MITSQPALIPAPGFNRFIPYLANYLTKTGRTTGNISRAPTISGSGLTITESITRRRR
ncbi:MAG: hypothetical protein LBK60_09480 [Verrucomicrobiales bacterium]|nr:hypothetical protein [Verrucomicrobiales bacterium]